MEIKLRNMTGVYLTRGENFLLLHREGGRVVNNVYTGSAGGHFEESELNDPAACALREMREEISVTEDMISGFKLRYITLRRTDGEIRQNYYYFAELKDSVTRELESNEGRLKWVPFDKALSLEMPFSARFMVEHYLNIGRFSDELYAGVISGDKMVFSCM